MISTPSCIFYFLNGFLEQCFVIFTLYLSIKIHFHNEKERYLISESLPQHTYCVTSKIILEGNTNFFFLVVLCNLNIYI